MIDIVYNIIDDNLQIGPLTTI